MAFAEITFEQAAAERIHDVADDDLLSRAQLIDAPEAVLDAIRRLRAGTFRSRIDLVAAVEAILYDECPVVVVGGGNSAGQATMHLAECCRTRQVHLVVRKPLGSGMSEYLVSRIRGASNITVHEGAEIAEVEGGHYLECVLLARLSDGARERLPCSGVFVFVGADPVAEWLPSGLARDDHGYVLTGSDALRSGLWPLTGRDPCPLETSLPGVLAAGDVRAGSTKRVGFAVGDGSLAVTCAHQLLSFG